MNSGAAKEEGQSVRIREERDNLNLTFESMVDGVYLVSKDRKLVFMNRVLREKFGDRVGDICYETFHERTVPCPLCKLSEVLDGKTVRWEWHSRMTGRIYDLVETPLTNADGTTSKLTIFRDITDRKRREAERAREERLRLQLLDELERSNNELKDFAYIVSHDLKAPLRAITSLAEWLAADYSDKLDEDGREQLELLKNRTRRMHNLIEGILTYSRIGRSKEEKEEVDLNTLVSEVIALIDPPENIAIEVVGELPTIPFERTRMEQIFQNLLGNAAMYMDKPEGRITISCTDDDDDSNWRFSVADNGPGIDEKYYKKIFQIFQTLKPRDEVESTGVGLTIVRKIVRMHGGEITVESKLGEGSTFHFTIPKEGNRGGGVS
jgi:signal transduction histidine kinase